MKIKDIKIYFKMLKKYNDNSEDIYELISREETDGNDKTIVRHENGSLKVEINSDSEDDDITFVDKEPLYPRDRLQ